MRFIFVFVPLLFDFIRHFGYNIKNGGIMKKVLINVGVFALLIAVIAVFAFGGTTNIKTSGQIRLANEDQTTTESFSLSYHEFNMVDGSLVDVEIPAEEVAGAGLPTSYTVEDLPVSIPAFNRTGYTFDGWYYIDASGIIDLSLDSASGEYLLPETAYGDIVLYANLEAIEYKIEFLGLPDGTSLNADNTYTIETGVPLSTIVPEIYGYRFVGWYTDEALTIPASDIPAGSTGNITVYAKIERIVVTITFSEQFDPIKVDFASIAYAEDGTGVLDNIVPTREGYTFDGWYTDPDFSRRSKIDSHNNYLTSDVTLYAKWNQQADPVITWIGVGLGGVAVIMFVVWWLAFRPKLED